MINKKEVEDVFNLLLDYITVKPPAYIAREQINLRQRFANLCNQINPKDDKEQFLVFLILYSLLCSIVLRILIPTDNTIPLIGLYFYLLFIILYCIIFIVKKI